MSTRNRVSGEALGLSIEPRAYRADPTREGDAVQTVSEALGGRRTRRGPGRRTWEPIRHSSRPSGREGLFWRPFDPKQRGRFMVAAERFERVNREKGKRNGPLGPVGLEVLRELLRLVDYRTGRLEPAITTLMERLRRSKDAIVRALANLRAAGFLDWLRRYEPTGNDEGPQVRQISNAYRLSLPAAAARLLGRLWRPAPIPDDERQRREQDAGDVASMIDGLPLWEQPAQLVDDESLSGALSRLGRAVAERESAKRSESEQEV